MLKFLRIRNLALLADVEIPLGGGLNLLTGETGAGKSILVDALGLALGARASSDQVRDGASRAVVEAVFRVAGSEGIAPILEAAGIDPDPEEPDPARVDPAAETDLIVRREVTADGSRAFVNGCPATVGTLRAVGERLFELHGQHRHLSLQRPASQLDLLDRFAGTTALRAQVAAAHGVLAGAARRLEEARAGWEDRDSRREALRLRLKEIDAVDPRLGEETDLRRERDLLAHAVRISDLLRGARLILEEDGEGALLGGAARLASILQELQGYLPECAAASEEIENARVALDDLAVWLRGNAPEVSQDPARLDQVERRLSDLAALQRRFGGDLPVVLEARERMRRDLEEFDAAANNPETRSRQVQEAAAAYATLAGKLSSVRRREARKLETATAAELEELAMGGTRVVVAVELQEHAGSPVVVRGVAVRPEARGVDHVEIRFSPNPGEEPRPVARAASGGELSRLMLALQGAVRGRREDAPRRLVFDEVDAGIGGGVAGVVGEKLHRLAREAQVICVTHLPQIASRADHHFQVEKVVAEGRTTTRVHALDQKGRVAEVARMLGGARITPATRRHAREMIGARP